MYFCNSTSLVIIHLYFRWVRALREALKKICRRLRLQLQCLLVSSNRNTFWTASSSLEEARLPWGYGGGSKVIVGFALSLRTMRSKRTYTRRELMGFCRRKAFIFKLIIFDASLFLSRSHTHTHTELRSKETMKKSFLEAIYFESAKIWVRLLAFVRSSRSRHRTGD